MMAQPQSAEVTTRPDAVKPWWKGAVIYQVYPRSFADSNDDGIGDLPGCLQHLDHIASLGVDAIWLSPFYRSPMRDFGYDVADYCDIDPTYGTMEDFDALLARAHALGLKVIIDLVCSHTSDQHDWFAQSRESRDNSKADWYVWVDPKPDGSPPTNWQSVFGGAAWEWDARRRQYYLHNFLTSQPDLNMHNPAVQEAMLGVVRFWLDKGVDGFRLDAVNFAMHDLQLRDNPPSGRDWSEITRPFDMQEHLYNQSHPDIVAFLERVRALINTYPGRFTVAEVGGPDPIDEMRAFTAHDRRLNSAYSFDFLSAKTLSPRLVEQSLGQWRGGADEGWPSWAFSNHDAPRCISRWADPEHHASIARSALLLLMSLRGNAFLYQGEELGLPQAHVAFADLQDWEAIANWPRTLGRDGARTPIPWRDSAPYAGFSRVKPWLPVEPRHLPLSVASQEHNHASMLQFSRAAIAMRKRTLALQTGSMIVIEASDDILHFQRHLSGMTLQCVFNLGSTPTSRSHTTPMTMVFDSILGDGAHGATAPTTLPPFSGFLAIAKS